MVTGHKARTGIWLSLLVALAAACKDSSGGSDHGPVDTQAPLTGSAISFSGIATTSVTVDWGAADDDWTHTSGLRYKVVRADELAQIDTLAEVDAITSGPGLVQDYLRTTSVRASGLEAATSYAFAVAVVDQTGNKALYAPATVTTLDASAPTPGGGISFADVTATTLTMSWGEASDDVTPKHELQYKVVRASMPSAIDTLAEVDAITNGPGLVQDFTAGITSQAVTGLSSSVIYAFAVVVRDAQGNESLYSPETVTTPDSTPPTIGTAIVFSDVAAHSLSVHWGFATDAVTGPFGLKYKVVKARDAASIDTLAEVDAIVSGDGLVADYTVGLLTSAVTGLDSSASYAFAVVVKDAAGNGSLYAPATVMTLDVSAPTVGTAISVSNTTTSGLTLTWGAATDDLTSQGDLQYKVVKAASAAAIDTIEEIALITTGSGLLQDFTAALLTKAVTGLSPGTSYAFAVVVKDQQGNQTIYAPVTQSTIDNTTPVPGTALSFANIATTALTVNWGKATDNVSSQADLQYKLVTAPTTNTIDTIAEIDAITTGPGLVMDFTADVATRNVTGLASSTSYAFSLLVRDAAGNKTLYAPATVRTLDVSAPVVGASLSFTSVTATQITVNWGAATDDVTPAASLSYKVVRGPDAASIDTLAEVDAITAAPGLVADFTANLTSTTATGLISSTSYAFSVVVRDAAGNRALYTPALRSTADANAPVVGTALSFSSVTDTSLNVDWGAATDDVTIVADLQYKVVSAAQTSDIDTLAEVAAITGAGLIQDFTANITTVAVTGITSSTTYAFAVVVRDASGNEALYAPGAVTTLDVSAPTPGIALSFSSVAATGMTVSWGAATDDITDAASLEYKLVTAATAADIDTLAEAAAITSGPGLVADFAANLLSSPVAGLTSSTVYAFAVVVRDAAGNQALYTPATQATLDVTAPTLGTGISFTTVASTSMTLNWGAASDSVTATADLEYKVVSAATAAEIDTLGEVDAITSGAGLIQNFTANLTTLPVAGLSSSTSYAFAVVVRDEAGNESLYAPATQATVDVTAPTPGTAISFANVLSTSLTVNWGAATDDLTAGASLEYKVVTAALDTAIDTLAEADAISGAGLIQDFTANLTSQAVTGLTGLTSYSFAVVVRDAVGNKALYAPASTTTPDATPPTPGAAISFSGVSTTGITVNWGAGTDDSTAPASLQYKLVRAATSAEIDTAAEADAIVGADLLADWTTNLLTSAVTGLSAGDFHFYAVVIRDLGHNLALYSPVSRVAGRIFYSTNQNHNANLGGPTGADGLCASQRDPRAATDASPKAVLADGTTRHACTTANCTSAAENLDWALLANTTYYNTSGGVIGTTNTAGIFGFPLTSAPIPGGSWHYSGIFNNWTTVASTTECSGYTEASSSTVIYLGAPSGTASSAFYAALTNCSNTTSVGIRVLCAE
jgi:hypothetical protein